jgi:diguanylate cyclase (GGDEF)-like protein
LGSLQLSPSWLKPVDPVLSLIPADHRDTLTKTRNRHSFDQGLSELLEALESGRVSRVTVLFLDLDQFKAVNDTLGHAVGDTLLKMVGERLKSICPQDAMPARLGGDEFALYLKDTSNEEAATLASGMVELVQRAFLIDGHVVHVGVSIGIAVAPHDASSRQELLKFADLALYHSKALGRGVFSFFTPAMEAKAQQRRSMELDLRKALVLRQFELRYQPQIDVENGVILALEGLLRWRHPGRGLLLPEDFMPLAEEIGVAISIAAWMIKTACKEAVRWPGDVKVAVNISPLSLETSKFASTVATALETTGLPGSRLEIEVTEDILLRDGASVLETLEQLRSLGVRVAMGSFGTGLASLSQLVNFPFAKIKIHPSLTGLHCSDTKRRAVVQAISALGRTMGIATLAEGVETSEHLADVRADGCQALQGFYSGAPLSPNDLPALFSLQPGSPSTHD